MFPSCDLMHRHRTYTRAPAFFLWLAVAGCGGSPAAPTPSATATDGITNLTGMVPVSGTTLQLGQTVTFSGKPSYFLASADSGAVVMVIQDQDNRTLQAGVQPTAVVAKGSGDVTLTQTITLPADGITVVNVFFLLAPTGSTSIRSSVRLSYPVR